MVSRELIQSPSFILSPWKLVQYLIFWFIGWNISASVNLSEFGFSISRIASFSEILLLWNVIKRTKTFLAVPLYFIYLSLRCLSSCHTFSAIFLSLFWIVSYQFIYLCQVNLLKCFFFYYSSLLPLGKHIYASQLHTGEGTVCDSHLVSWKFWS